MFESLLGGFEKYEELFEGIFMLLAVGMLTPVIIWMHRNSRNIRSGLEKRVKSAVSGKQILGLAAVSFLSVYREGVETVLFLKASALNSSAGQTLTGGALGTMAAVALAALIFRGSEGLNLEAFFRVTGIILVFFAAGLSAHGIHELQEAGVLPVFIEHVWDTNGIINEKGIAGSFLAALVGYNGNPSLLEVAAWVIYVASVGRVFITPSKKLKQAPSQI